MTKMFLRSLVVAFAGLVCFIEARQIPEYIHICARNDPHVSKCIRDSIEALRPRLKTGIPELSVPGLEPLHIREIAVARETSNFKAYLRNLNILGVGDFKLGKLKLNIANNTYRVDVKFPKFDIVGDCDIDARLLVVPIKGKGKFSAKISDVEGRGVLKAEIINYNGHRQLNFTSFDFQIVVGDYDINLEDIFHGDKILSQATRDVLQENKVEFISAALPFIQQKAADLLLTAANRITDDLDYDLVFPEK